MNGKDKVKKLLRQQKRQLREDMMVEKKEAKAESRLKKAYSISKEKGDALNKRIGYNYDAAIKAGMQPQDGEHWASRDPETGEIFKAKGHPTFFRTKRAEKSLGYKIKKIKGKLYSVPKK